MNEIIKIIINANKERRLLFDAEVKRICLIILNILKYKNIRIAFDSVSSLDPNTGAELNGKKITFYYEGRMSLIEKDVESTLKTFSFDCSSIDLYNFFYVIMIIHEIAHLRQKHIVYDTNYHSYEKRLFKPFYLLPNESLNKIYENDITEINANNLGFVMTTYLYSKMPKEYCSQKDLVSFQKLLANRLLFQNYDVDHNKEKVIGPAEKLIDVFTEEDYEKMRLDKFSYENLIYCNDLTIYKKLLLGLPISYLEYSYANTMFEGIACEPSVNYVKKIQKNIY